MVEDKENTCIIVVEVSSGDEVMVIGALADSVKAVFEISQSEIEPAPGIGTLLDSRFIHGMGKVDEGFVIILNLDQVLSTGDLETDETVEQENIKQGFKELAAPA